MLFFPKLGWIIVQKSSPLVFYVSITSTASTREAFTLNYSKAVTGNYNFFIFVSVFLSKDSASKLAGSFVSRVTKEVWDITFNCSALLTHQENLPFGAMTVVHLCTLQERVKKKRNLWPKCAATVLTLDVSVQFSSEHARLF